MKGIPVLMYHAIETGEVSAGATDAGEQRYVVTLEQFQKQMEYLHQEGFQSCLLKELLELKNWPEKGVVITFDDGHASDFSLALPILHKYGFKGEFFITTEWLGGAHYLKGDEVAVLHQSGMGIGSHGLSHAFFEEMDEPALVRELRDSKEQIEKLIKTEILAGSAPGGRVGPGVGGIARTIGYRFLCTSEPGLFTATSPPYAVPRLAVRENTDMAEFSLMVNGDSRFLDRMIRRERVLSIAKRVLGEKGYQLLRKRVLEMS